MATKTFNNNGPIYITAEKYNEKRLAGQLVAGLEYKIIDWEALEKLTPGTNVSISDDNEISVDLSGKVDKEEGKGLFSGSYNDLTDKPSIPSVEGLASETWVELKGYLTELPDYSNTYAAKLHTHSYNDLTDKPNTEIYGVRHYYNLASPTLIRIGNLSCHKTLPIQSLMKRCLVTDNGNVTYLHPSDSTKLLDGTAAVLDGSAGQVMVEIPEHYRKFTLDDETYDCEISLYSFLGAHKINKCYISAYEASLDRTNNKLSSVVNDTAQYRGGNNTSGWDGTYRSLLGKPATNISLTNFRTYANNRGSNWKCLEWDIYCTVFWLYTVEYASLNCQLAYNSAITADGYKQGGLSAGVTNIDGSKWSVYNGYNPFINCGITNSLGNKSGTVSFSFDADQQAAYGAAWLTNVPSYRGIENPFGHIWKWTDGVLAKGTGTVQEYYKTLDRSAYSSTITDNYTKVGESPTANGYKKEILRNPLGDIMTTIATGSDTTYFCDYHYLSVSNGTTYGFLSGGSASGGGAAGFGSLSSSPAPSGVPAYFGSRLCYCLATLIISI